MVQLGSMVPKTKLYKNMQYNFVKNVTLFFMPSILDNLLMYCAVVCIMHLLFICIISQCIMTS